MAPRRSPSPPARRCSAAPQTPRPGMVCCHGRARVRRPTRSGDSWNSHGPRAPWHAQGVPSPGMGSGTLAVGLPPPAALVRAPAPVLHPPRVSRVPSPPGLGRWRAAPAGSRPCPPWSRRRLPCVRGPRPRRRVWCLSPLLPTRPRPSPRAARVGAPQSPSSACSPAPFSRLQACAPVPARRGARHPEHSSRSGLHRRAAVPFPSEPLPDCDRPVPRRCDPSASGHGRYGDVHPIRCAALSAAPRTPGVSRCRKRERGTSGRWRQSAGRLG